MPGGSGNFLEPKAKNLKIEWMRRREKEMKVNKQNIETKSMFIFDSSNFSYFKCCLLVLLSEINQVQMVYIYR